MNWRRFVPWMKTERKDSELFPTKKALAEQEANKKFLAMDYPGCFGGRLSEFVIERCYNSCSYAFAASIFFGIYTFAFVSLLLPISIAEAYVGSILFGCMACWFVGILGISLTLDLPTRRSLYLSELRKAHELLDCHGMYHCKIRSEASLAIETLANTEQGILRAELDGIEQVIGESENVYKCVGSCALCGCLADARALRDRLQACIDAIEDRKKNLITRSNKIVDDMVEKERKQIAVAQQEKAWLEEVRQNLQLPA